MDDERFGELLSQAARRPARPADIAMIRRRGLRRRRTAQATAAAAVLVLAGGLVTVAGQALPDGQVVVLAPTPPPASPAPAEPTPAPDPTPTPEPAEPDPEPAPVPEPQPAEPVEPDPGPVEPAPHSFTDASGDSGFDTQSDDTMDSPRPEQSRGGPASGAAGGADDGVLMLPAHDGGPTMDALLQARVIGDREQGCVWLLPEGGEPIAGVWPPGYHARFEPLRVYDAGGVEVGRQGQLLDVGGGQSTMVDPVPPHCRTGDRVWVVGSVRPSDG